MVVDVRGTSGSGKTTTVLAVMTRLQSDGHIKHVLQGPTGRIQDYCFVPTVGRPVTFLGRYETPTGGCDTIQTQDEICFRVRHYAHYGHVVFEGLLVSGLFGRYAKLAAAIAPQPYIWAFLDTPLEVCLARVQRRRDTRATKRVFRPDSTIEKWHTVRRAAQRARAARLDVRTLDQARAAEIVWGWLRLANEDPGILAG